MDAPENTRFVGVPISVAIPPMLAEYAMPSISTEPKFFRILCSSAPGSFANCTTTAMPIGSIIMAQAVFDIHIDRNAVATMNPSTSRVGFTPTRRIVCSAILRCRFHFWIASATTKPPK